MTIVNTVQNMDWRELARRVRDEVGSVSAVITDCPYSERTHKGHDDGVDEARLAGEERRMRVDRRTGAVYSVGVSRRRAINYQPWGPADVSAFVEAWAPLTRGWIVSLTDHVLAPAWEAAMEAAGRYTFAPIACVEPGSRCRMLGDGPAQWSTFAIVSRPRSGEWLAERHATRKARDAKCALPGAYVAGEHGKDVPGGKPLALMEALVRDYSEPGDLIADPCAGGGTTLLAAKLLGRRYVGSDISAEHVEIARERLRDLPTKDKRGTLSLFGGDR